MIVSVKKGEQAATHLPRVSFEDAGIREVQDLQKWILAKPEVLGEELLPLDEQFKDFDRARDRLDILCIDRQARLVVIELKRTEKAGHAELQALRYAAMVRKFTIDEAADTLFRSNHGRAKGLTQDQAKREIMDFITDDDTESVPSQLGEPRIILVSPGFSEQVLVTARYLSDHRIDVKCVALSAYRIGEGHFILVPDVVMPIPEVEDYSRRISEKAEATQPADRTRVQWSLNFLFDKGEVKGGETLLLKHNLPDYVKYREGDPEFRATVVIQDGVPKIRWEKDGNLYSPSRVGIRVFREQRASSFASPLVSGWQGGSMHWGTQNESLRSWADRIRTELQE